MGRKSKHPLMLEEMRSPLGKKRGLTQVELQERCGISAGCVNRHIHKLHAERQIYIAGWKTDVGAESGGCYSARYKVGNKPDAPKPRALTSAEKARRFRRRAIESGKIEDVRAYNRAYWWRKQPARRDPLAAALFGSAGMSA